MILCERILESISSCLTSTSPEAAIVGLVVGAFDLDEVGGGARFFFKREFLWLSGNVAYWEPNEMRYRRTNSPADISGDIAVVMDFIGVQEFRESLSKIHRSLNSKGFVTPFDDEAFALELDLLNIERLRTECGGNLTKIPQKCHLGLDFLIGLGQTIPVLSFAAKTRLLGRIRKGFDEGLWPLHHELRVAANLSYYGWDVSFHGLEVDGGCDVLATKDGVTFEAEAKAISAYTGLPIKPDSLTKLQIEVKEHFDCFDDILTPIVAVTLASNLPVNRTQLQQIVSQINSVVRNEIDSSNALGEFQFIGKIPLTSPGSVMLAAKFRMMRNKNAVLVQHVHPRLILEVASNSPNQLPRKIIRTINEAAREQFSGLHPGLIWTHLSFMPKEMFTLLSTPQHPKACLFDGIANAVYHSEKRNHISQPCFTGGSFLQKTGETMRSSSMSAIYNSPACRFGKDVLLPGGRTRDSTEKSEQN